MKWNLYQGENKLFRFAFFAIWIILGFFQAYHMELLDDEAYYWVYGQHLDWGHFHQPPMVALWIKAGYSIFENELGVRLIFLLAHFFTLFFIERLTYPKDDRLFAVLVSSLVLMHIGGFWAVPDIPYLFFTASFLYFTKKYLDQDKIGLAIILAINIACLFYSKYHGIVVIGAAILANLKLFRRPSFYLIGIVALVLFLPHLYWLYDADFVTLEFHLAERDRAGFKSEYPFLFLGGLILVTGPILGFITLFLGFKFKPKTDFDRTLKFVLLGIVIFFGLMSFRSRIEANWMVAANLPLLIIAHRMLLKNPTLTKWVYYSFPVSLGLAIFLRIIVTFPILSTESNLMMKLREFHHNESWVETIEKQADGRPVIFNSGYQRPSKYLFYSNNKKATTLTPVNIGATQFELYNFEEEFQGSSIMMVYNQPEFDADTIQHPRAPIYYRYIDDFCSFTQVDIEVDMEGLTFKAGKTVDIPIRIDNEEDIDFTCDGASNSFIGYLIFKKKKTVKLKRTDINVQRVVNTDGYYNLSIDLPEEKGDYLLNISIWTDYLPPTHNTTRFKIKVE